MKHWPKHYLEQEIIFTQRESDLFYESKSFPFDSPDTEMLRKAVMDKRVAFNKLWNFAMSYNFKCNEEYVNANFINNFDTSASIRMCG